MDTARMEEEGFRNLRAELERQYGLVPENALTAQEWEEALARRLNELVLSDFPGLIRILYRIDVDENKLKHLLAQNEGEQAGRILARLIIERQIQKNQSRKDYPSNHSATEEEKW
jgi:hypothetical protein